VEVITARFKTEANMAEEGKTRLWHAIEIKDVLSLLESSEEGIDGNEAELRLERTGTNALSAEGP